MKRLLFWVLLSKVLLVLLILYGGVGLMPDEAQYWTWSKQLSYGYYSKPPGIAWQIALGTTLFGDTEFGVRFVGVVLSFFLSFAIYWLTKLATDDFTKAFWAAVTFSFCPLGLLSGFLATTDCAYVLFWTLACALFIRQLYVHNGTQKRKNAKAQKTESSLLVVGVVIALGALWKWPVYAVWLPIIAFSWRTPTRLIQGIAISLLGLLPSLIWNIEHGFATFQHVAHSIDNVASAAKRNPVEFLLAQVALVSPILFFLLVRAMMLFRQESRELRFCWWTSFAFFVVVFTASFFEKVQGNWAVAAYPTGFVIMVCYSSPFWCRVGAVVAVVCIAIAFIWQKPLKEGIGWNSLKAVLERSGYDPHRDFLFSDRYQATSILSFYGPEQKRAYFFNIHALRHNQFDYWPQMHDECLQKSGYFVEFVPAKDAESASQRFKEKLAPYFDKVHPLPPQMLCKDKVAIILSCSSYLGTEPSQTNKY